MSNFLIKNYVIFSPLPAKYREGYTGIYTQKKQKSREQKKEESAGLFSVITKGEPCRAVDDSQKTGERNRIFIDSGCHASLDTSEP